jgi:beta-phosphoglucomutase-like phosphatase (HAD superfamily)
MAKAEHAVLFDLDGTLVDSVFHHARVWHDVLLDRGTRVPHWKIHRGIGLPGERLLAWLLGESPSDRDQLIAEHHRRFLASTSSLTETDGANALLRDLEAREVPFQVISSADEETRDALFKTLGRTLPIAPAPAKKSSKPHADPLMAAAHDLGIDPNQLSFIGDAIWDGEAARRSGVHFIGLRCGGTSDALLEHAGALWIEDAPRDLVGRL